MVAYLKKVIRYFDMRQKKTKWHIYASHACFYVLVSSVPLLMLLLMLSGRLFPHRIDHYLDLLRAYLPEQLSSYIPDEFIHNAMTADIPVMSVTAFAMIWSSSKGMRAISQGLESVYGLSDRHSYLKGHVFALLYTVVFIALIFFALSVLVFGETIVSFLELRGSEYKNLARAFIRSAWAFSFIIFVLIFALMYKFMAGRDHPLYRHLPGAAFAAGGWVVYSALLSLYLRWFNPEKYLLYGSLGALILLMLWTHSCMTMLMLGGELNVLLLKRPLLVRVQQKQRKN